MKFSLWAAFALGALAKCPYMGDEVEDRDAPTQRRTVPHNRDANQSSSDFLSQFSIDNNDTYLTSDVGGPFSDQNSLSAGERGPTLLEDFIFRQKIQHFDHERVRR